VRIAQVMCDRRRRLGAQWRTLSAPLQLGVVRSKDVTQIVVDAPSPDASEGEMVCRNSGDLALTRDSLAS